MVRYMECQKNHAAHLGGHVLDGCGEFMPAGEEGTPLALKCAACDCHRNFHRREAEVGSSTAATTTTPPPHPSSTTPNCYISFANNNNISKPTVIRPQPRAPVMMAFGGGAAAESSSEDQAAAAQFAEQYGVSKKRFRTKFTQEQKDKMAEFADRIGWRIQKQDESELQRFCQEVGVQRQVFKVWLHNNKQASKRKQP